MANCTLVPTLVPTLDFLPRIDVDSPLDPRPHVRDFWEGIATDPVSSKVIKEMRNKLAEYRRKRQAAES